MAGASGAAIQRHLAHHLVFLVGLIVTTLHAPAVSANNASACPSLVGTATRLFVGVAPSMSSSTGTAQLFLRDSVDERWQLSGTGLPVTFGRNGLGWSFDQTDLAGTDGNAGAPVKAEGDGRSPAGLFAAGRPFGFADSKLQNYILIGAGTVCVDDPASPVYNQVVSLKTVPKTVSHENMREIALYRSGLIIKTPTNKAVRGGSCIFLHVWRAPGRATSGCVAMSESNVIRVQEFFDGERSMVALLPQSSLGILSRCGLPEWQGPGQ